MSVASPVVQFNSCCGLISSANIRASSIASMRRAVRMRVVVTHRELSCSGFVDAQRSLPASRYEAP